VYFIQWSVASGLTLLYSIINVHLVGFNILYTSNFAHTYSALFKRSGDRAEWATQSESPFDVIFAFFLLGVMLSCLTVMNWQNSCRHPRPSVQPFFGPSRNEQRFGGSGNFVRSTGAKRNPYSHPFVFTPPEL